MPIFVLTIVAITPFRAQNARENDRHQQRSSAALLARMHAPFSFDMRRTRQLAEKSRQEESWVQTGYTGDKVHFWVGEVISIGGSGESAGNGGTAQLVGRLAAACRGSAPDAAGLSAARARTISWNRARDATCLPCARWSGFTKSSALWARAGLVGWAAGLLRRA